jgi:exonuclease III
MENQAQSFKFMW